MYPKSPSWLDEGIPCPAVSSFCKLVGLKDPIIDHLPWLWWRCPHCYNRIRSSRTVLRTVQYWTVHIEPAIVSEQMPSPVPVHAGRKEGRVLQGEVPCTLPDLVRWWVQRKIRFAYGKATHVPTDKQPHGSQDTRERVTVLHRTVIIIWTGISSHRRLDLIPVTEPQREILFSMLSIILHWFFITSAISWCQCKQNPKGITSLLT